MVGVSFECDPIARNEEKVGVVGLIEAVEFVDEYSGLFDGIMRSIDVVYTCELVEG